MLADRPKSDAGGYRQVGKNARKKEFERRMHVVFVAMTIASREFG